MKDRIKKIRKELDLTQQKLADRIGVQRNTIAMYEMGKTVPSEAIILSICREFNVNEQWLRDGTGEIFIELDKEDLLMQWAGKVLGSESTPFKKNFVKLLMSLTEDEWEFLEQKARELVNYEKED